MDLRQRVVHAVLSGSAVLGGGSPFRGCGFDGSKVEPAAGATGRVAPSKIDLSGTRIYPGLDREKPDPTARTFQAETDACRRSLRQLA